jgi:DHA1 family bicyclomycin/chloramphenicol resistance-like MFS transporter
MSRVPAGTILILGALCAFAPLSIDMYLPALPDLERHFLAPATSVQLTLSAFLAGLAIGQAFYGPLSDRLGRKRPLFFGLTLYVLASLGCAFAPDVHSLVALRFLQALGGCAGSVIAQATVRDRVGGQDAARIFSLLLLVMGVAPILAPLLGGYVLLWLGWRAIFLVLAGFGIACLLAVAFALDESRPPEKRITGGIGVALATYGGLVGNPRFLGLMLNSGFAMAGMFVYITASPHLFIEVHGVPPQAYGWLFGLNAIGMIGASQLNRALLGRFAAAYLLRAGIAVNFLASLALLAIALAAWGGLPALLVPLFITIASLGFVMPNAMAIALSRDPANAGSAAALMGTSPFLGGALAGAVVAALHGGAAVSMAAVIVLCSLIAFTANRFLVGPPSA